MYLIAVNIHFALVALQSKNSVLTLLSIPAAGAGLSGMKMASRIGTLEDFEFKAVGENNEHGVSILSCFFLFCSPWSKADAVLKLMVFLKYETTKYR